MRGWYASRFGLAGRGGATRAIEWTCMHDRALAVRHCGHPTALRPYFVVRDGVSMLNELGTFPGLAMAQYAAVTSLRAGPPRA